MELMERVSACVKYAIHQMTEAGGSAERRGGLLKELGVLVVKVRHSSPRFELQRIPNFRTRLSLHSLVGRGRALFSALADVAKAETE